MAKSNTRFKIACRMLRLGGMPSSLPLPRRSESPIDFLVRAGLAKDPHTAADMLLLGAGLAVLVEDVLKEIDPAGGDHD